MTVVQGKARLHLMLVAELAAVKNYPYGTGFEYMKVSWRAARAWNCVAGLESQKKD